MSSDPKPKVAMKPATKMAPKAAPKPAGAPAGGKIAVSTSKEGAPPTSTTAPVKAAARAPFAEGWMRFVSEPLAEWMKADLSQVLVATAGLEDKVKVVVAEFNELPEHAEAFRKMIASMRNSSEVPPIENAVRMYGVVNSMLYVSLCKLSGTLQDPKAIPRDPKTGLFTAKIQDMLPCVSKIRTGVGGDDGRYRDSALAAALVFDLILLHSNREPNAETRKTIREIVDRGTGRAFYAIRIGIALARRMKRLVLEPEIPATILLYEAGVAMASIYVPGYEESNKDWSDSHAPPSLRLVEESRLFGSASSAFAEACSWIAPVLTQAGVVAGTIQAPFSLGDTKERDQSDLGSLCLLALYLHEHPTLLAGTVPYKVSDMRPELNQLELTFVPSEVAKDAAE